MFVFLLTLANKLCLLVTLPTSFQDAEIKSVFMISQKQVSPSPPPSTSNPPQPPLTLESAITAAALKKRRADAKGMCSGVIFVCVSVQCYAQAQGG